MRHRKGFNHLSRKAGHRRAMLANMAASLIKNKRITTTTAKAKALRSYVEPLITKSKEDTTHSRRVVFSYIQDKDAITELFREISPKVLERPGGYTRILKLDNRPGDNAEMALIELVDFNENLLAETSGKASTTRRRRRGSSSKQKTETTKAKPTAVETADAEQETVEDVKSQGEAITQEEVAEEVNAGSEIAETLEPAEAENKEVQEEQEEEAEETKAEAQEEKPAEEDEKEENEKDKKES